VSAALRDGDGVLRVDLHPQRTIADLAVRLQGRAKDSTATTLRRAGVSAVGAGLAREATGNRLPADPHELAALLKAVPVRTAGPQPIARAISSAGGIALDEVDDDDFMLRRRPGTFVCGEMLDWEAPTGGYLLQATCSTARAAARGALQWLRS
jgi:predicted flavoprotein YhiN